MAAPAPTSDLADARRLLVKLLTDANFTVTVRGAPVAPLIVKHVPQTFQPPIVWVAPGSPYRQQAPTFGQKRINLVALCIGGQTTNDETEDVTEELAEKVAGIIDASTTFQLDPNGELDQPRLYPSSQNQQMLGIAVNLFCLAER